jgi:hypothetical protein
MTNERILSYKLSTKLSKEDLHDVNATVGSNPTQIITYGPSTFDVMTDIS